MKLYKALLILSTIASFVGSTPDEATPSTTKRSITAVDPMESRIQDLTEMMYQNRLSIEKRCNMGMNPQRMKDPEAYYKKIREQIEQDVRNQYALHFLGK